MPLDPGDDTTLSSTAGLKYRINYLGLFWYWKTLFTLRLFCAIDIIKPFSGITFICGMTLIVVKRDGSLKIRFAALLSNILLAKPAEISRAGLFVMSSVSFYWYLFALSVSWCVKCKLFLNVQSFVLLILSGCHTLIRWSLLSTKCTIAHSSWSRKYRQ